MSKNVFRSKQILWIVFIGILFFWFDWSMMAKPQGTASIAWGNIMTIKGQNAADHLGFKKPGPYFGTRNGKNYAAVRGGLKMIFTANFDLGFRAMKKGVFSTTDGYIFTGTFVLWLITIILIIFWRRGKPRKAQEPSA